MDSPKQKHKNTDQGNKLRKKKKDKQKEKYEKTGKYNQKHIRTMDKIDK